MTTTPATITGDLCLGHILAATGLDLSDVVILRHTYTEGGLESPIDITPEKVRDYTRRQEDNNKLGKTPPRIWLIFMADGGRRSRFLTAYENHGEVPAERTGALRYFDIRPSEVLTALDGRLVVEWSRDAVNWAKSAAIASAFRVIELADPEVVPFPGFDRVLITHGELQAVLEDSRCAAWRTALGAVQGIYLIADTSTGHILTPLPIQHPAGLRPERAHRRGRRSRVTFQTRTAHTATRPQPELATTSESREQWCPTFQSSRPPPDPLTCSHSPLASCGMARARSATHSTGPEDA